LPTRRLAYTLTLRLLFGLTRRSLNLGLLLSLLLLQLLHLSARVSVAAS